MGAADIVWMVLILTGAGYLFYRSVIKKKGHCPGCDHGSCDKEQDRRHRGGEEQC